MLVLPPPKRARVGEGVGICKAIDVRGSPSKFGVMRVVDFRRGLSRPTDSSCPGLPRASTPFFRFAKTWMAGTSPAMTTWKGCCPRPQGGLVLLLGSLQPQRKSAPKRCKALQGEGAHTSAAVEANSKTRGDRAVSSAGHGGDTSRGFSARRESSHKLVMPGLDPGIHAFLSICQDVDGRDKPGHDDAERMLPRSPRAL